MDRRRVVVHTGPGKTEQAHKRETDMNYILKEYAKTGFMKHSKEHQGRYDDVSVQSFQEAMFTVTSAQSMFNELPAAVRKRFMNNPAEFLGFVQNPENKEEMQRMGILKGNDGVDITGAPVMAPTEDDVRKAARPPEKSPSEAFQEPSGAEKSSSRP